MTDQSQHLADDMSLDSAVPRQSNYLSKEDCDPPILAEVAYMTIDEIESDGRIESRAVLHFNGDLKPMVLNQTNKELLKAATGASTVGAIRGKKVVLYNDPTIMFGGKMVGGIRLRAPKHQPPLPDYDDVPY